MRSFLFLPVFLLGAVAAASNFHPSRQPAILASQDGICGQYNGSATCAGSGFGSCCSQFGFCGNSPLHCNLAGCQAGFGSCGSSSSTNSSTLIVSTSSTSTTSISSSVSSVASVATSTAAGTTTSTSSLATCTAGTTVVWASLGCYSDNVAARSLGHSPSVIGDMTIEKCQVACQLAGYALAGTEYSAECYCDNALQNSPSSGSSNCYMPCAGDHTEICGGPNGLTLFQGTRVCASPAASSTSNSTSPTATSKPAVAVSQWTSAGCYTDAVASRSLRFGTSVSGSVTIEACQAACHAIGYPLAGVEYGAECYCDVTINSAAQTANDAACTSMPCQGNQSETCGGPNRVWIYQYSTLPQSGNVYSPPVVTNYSTCVFDPTSSANSISLIDSADGLPFINGNGLAIKATVAPSIAPLYTFTEVSGSPGIFDLMLNGSYLAVLQSGQVIFTSQSSGQQFITTGGQTYITSLFSFSCDGTLTMGVPGLEMLWGMANNDLYMYPADKSTSVQKREARSITKRLNLLELLLQLEKIDPIKSLGQFFKVLELVISLCSSGNCKCPSGFTVSGSQCVSQPPLTSSSSSIATTTSSPLSSSTSSPPPSTTSLPASATSTGPPYCTPTFKLQISVDPTVVNGGNVAVNGSYIQTDYYVQVAYAYSVSSTYVISSTGLWRQPGTYVQTICGSTGGNLGSPIGYTDDVLSVQGSYYPPFECSLNTTNSFSCTFGGSPVSFYYNTGDNQIWWSINGAMERSGYSSDSYYATLKAVRSDSCAVSSSSTSLSVASPATTLATTISTPSTSSTVSTTTTSSAPACTPTFQLQMTIVDNPAAAVLYSGGPSVNGYYTYDDYYIYARASISSATKYTLNPSTGLWADSGAAMYGTWGFQVLLALTSFVETGWKYPAYVCSIGSNKVLSCTLNGAAVAFYYNRGDGSLFTSVNNAQASSSYAGQTYLTTLTAVNYSCS